jgi:hypothetical protein
MCARPIHDDWSAPEMARLKELLADHDLPAEARALIDEADAAIANARDTASYTQHLEAEIKTLRGQLGLSQGGAGLTFNQQTGTHVDASGVHHCTKCLASEKRSPLKCETAGWRCMVCAQWYRDPNHPLPRVVRAAPDDYGGPNGWMR